MAADDPGATQERTPRHRGFLRSRRAKLAVLGVSLVATFIGVVGPISLSRNNSGPPPVLPNTQGQFSLDMKVVGTVQHDVVYAVEQRARPAYRIFAFDPATGIDTTVFSVPQDAIIYGIALSPDRSTLAVSYSADFHIYGSGISLLDLTTNKLREITPPVPGIFEVNLEWSNDAASVYSTHVDQRTPIQQLAIAQTTIVDRTTTILVKNAVNPRFANNNLYYLPVDETGARRSIQNTASDEVVSVGDGTFDLGHLLRGANEGSLHVTVIKPNSGTSVTVGTPARAHGNHDVPSTWWHVSTSKVGQRSGPLGLDPTIVYDAASRDGLIVYATQEGLSIAEGSKRTALLASRAIRLVAA
jgi:hypothetical protein